MELFGTPEPKNSLILIAVSGPVLQLVEAPFASTEVRKSKDDNATSPARRSLGPQSKKSLLASVKVVPRPVPLENPRNFPTPRSPIPDAIRPLLSRRKGLLVSTRAGRSAYARTNSSEPGAFARQTDGSFPPSYAVPYSLSHTLSPSVCRTPHSNGATSFRVARMFSCSRSMRGSIITNGSAFGVSTDFKREC